MKAWHRTTTAGITFGSCLSIVVSFLYSLALNPLGHSARYIRLGVRHLLCHTLPVTDVVVCNNTIRTMNQWDVQY